MSADIIYGRHAVHEALVAGEELLELEVSEAVRPQGLVRDILNRARGADVPVKWMPPAALDRRFAEYGGRGRHQGIIAVVPGFTYTDLAQMLGAALAAGEPPFLLALDSVQDVHNVGSLLRTAEAVGVHGVILGERGGAAVTPAVRNASAGAVAHLRIGRLDLVGALDELQARGVRVAAMDESGAHLVHGADLSGPLVLVVGGEGRGLRSAVARRVDVALRLPMRGQVGSLNVAVAGSVALYEALRQRAGDGDGGDGDGAQGHGHRSKGSDGSEGSDGSDEPAGAGGSDIGAGRVSGDDGEGSGP